MSTGQTAKRIFTLNGSNDSVWYKKVPFGVLLNESFPRNFSFLVSCRSELVKCTSMQACAVQGRLIGLPGLSVCSKFLIETITKINE
jgi:hypothetical protein